jgi:hypothetical protein
MRLQNLSSDTVLPAPKPFFKPLSLRFIRLIMPGPGSLDREACGFEKSPGMGQTVFYSAFLAYEFAHFLGGPKTCFVVGRARLKFFEYLSALPERKMRGSSFLSDAVFSGQPPLAKATQRLMNRATPQTGPRRNLIQALRFLAMNRAQKTHLRLSNFLTLKSTLQLLQTHTRKKILALR